MFLWRYLFEAVYAKPSCQGHHILYIILIDGLGIPSIHIFEDSPKSSTQRRIYINFHFLVSTSQHLMEPFARIIDFRILKYFVFSTIYLHVLSTIRCTGTFSSPKIKTTSL